MTGSAGLWDAPQGRPSAAPARPTTRAARLAQIRDILVRRAIRSQAELADVLAVDGTTVAQATLSRDLLEIGAERVRDEAGQFVYAVPDGAQRLVRPNDPDQLNARLARLASETLVTVEAAAHLVVLRTPPGAAQYLASAVDHGVLPGIIGTIAGDDTVLVICRTPAEGDEVAAQLLALAGSTSSHLED